MFLLHCKTDPLPHTILQPAAIHDGDDLRQPNNWYKFDPGTPAAHHLNLFLMPIQRAVRWVKAQKRLHSNMKKNDLFKRWLLVAFCLTATFPAKAQTNKGWWHDNKGVPAVTPAGQRFCIVWGNPKFNRCTAPTPHSTGWRRATCLEFAMYMRSMGGNCKIGIISQQEQNGSPEAAAIKTIYRPGSMIYEIKDSILGKGQIILTILAMADAEGMIAKVETVNLPDSVFIGGIWRRYGKIQPGWWYWCPWPWIFFYLKPEYCKTTAIPFTKTCSGFRTGLQKHKARKRRTLQRYNTGTKLLIQRQKEKPKQIIGLFPENAEVVMKNAENRHSVNIIQRVANLSLPLVAAHVPAEKTACFILSWKKKKRRSHTQMLRGYLVNADEAYKKLPEGLYCKRPMPSSIHSVRHWQLPDGIWESPSYLHGAIAWRMRLPACGGCLLCRSAGWHDRARFISPVIPYRG